ncbi:MAG: hypothetical protein KF729_38110 [Sandaracinaceae bacterium]|nr:hypothetical protein [Sandaracinaceae bacterium]
MARARGWALAVSLGLLGTSCYLAHRTRDRDGGDEPDARRATTASACCVALACRDEPCADGEECTPHGCAPSCEGTRCGARCCGASERCVGGACGAPATACVRDADCVAPERCDPVGGTCAPRGESGCYAARPFEPELVWEARFDAITVPVLAQLNDDDGDGRIGPTDVADVVVVEHGHGARRLVALSGIDGRPLWIAGDGFTGFCSFSTLATGDLDGDGVAEVVALGRRIEPHRHVGEGDCRRVGMGIECPLFPPDRGPFHDHGLSIDSRVLHRHTEHQCADFGDNPTALLVLSHRGELMRVVELPLGFARERRIHTVTIADLDGDGVPEIVAGGAVIDPEGVRWADERLAGVSVVAADVDGDGRSELFTTRHAFDADGRLRWTDGAIAIDGHVAIARVLEGASPEVIAADGRRIVIRDARTGEARLGPLGYAAGMSAGPPTIADFDGDGRTEIGIAATHAYVVLDLDLPPPHVRWELRSRDTTPGTVGAAAFDFDGDGAADVAYADECHLVILSGRDGTPRWARSNPSLTVWEYPIVADLDGDGRAELLAVSNRLSLEQSATLGCGARTLSFSETPGGIRLFRDRLGNWAGTRPTWNQHGYDRSVDEAGHVSAHPAPWASHNTVRANPWSGAADAEPLPDLRLGALRLVAVACGGDDVVLEARVENHGNAAAAAGVEVDLGGAGAARTTQVILPGMSAWVASPPIARRRLAAVRLEARLDPRERRAECDRAIGQRLAADLTCTR